MLRYLGLIAAFSCAIVFGGLLFWSHLFLSPFVIAVLLSGIGVWDMLQTKHNLRRNYPLFANLRFMLETVRPEIRQYFLESDLDGTPFNRSKRALVYQRAKAQLDLRPFGTQQDVYGGDFEWINHSVAPRPTPDSNFRVTVGGPQCAQPYSISLYNISAMSFGALSANAIRALNKGANLGKFAHDTGEGGLSRYHREFGGDIIWEIGSGYFGCRDQAGRFSPERFVESANDPQVRMIEIKLSQGAKPGHGGVLPAPKVSAEIAAARGVPRGVDCISPECHSAFSTPRQMMTFIATLRRLSNGKPVGFKLCIGHPWEFMAICKAMLETGIYADFVVVDGKEGGTGAAPLEFADHVGTPMREGLNFVHNCLVGAGLREHIRIGAAGRIITGFDIARALALGADWCNAARGFMFALGCIQSQSCHTDRCPSGVATQDPRRQNALVVPDKAERVRRFHDNTLAALAELVGAAGLSTASQIGPDHILRRVAQSRVASFGEIYPRLAPGALINGSAKADYDRNWTMANCDSFAPHLPECVRPAVC